MTWQNLIRDWLRRTAEQRLREAMAAAARGEDAFRREQPASENTEDGPADAHVGVVICEHRAAVGLIDRLEGLLTIEADQAQVFEGGLGGKRLALIVPGSAKAAGEAAEALIDGHRPGLLVSAGFGTALTDDISLGDLFQAERVVAQGDALPLEAPAMRSEQQLVWRRGRLQSGDSIPADATARQKLAEQSGAAAAMSHAAAVAGVARERNLRCAALCVIRHGRQEQTPRDLELLRRKQPWSRKMGLLTGMALSRPGSLKNVMNEKEQDLMMADRLAEGIAALVASMTRVAGWMLAAGIVLALAAPASFAQEVQPPPLLPLPPEAREQLEADIPPPLPMGETTFPAKTGTDATMPVESPAASGPIVDPTSLFGVPDNDLTSAGLRRATESLLQRSGGDPRHLPLAEKADFLEWVLWRYHRNPYGQIATVAELPTEPGLRPRWPADSDTSTWNGALLSALCWKYAVTKDPETLRRITTLVDGLEFYTQITGRPGCYARCVALGGDRADPNLQKFGIQRAATASGEPLTWIGDPAKGTYNQLAGGYATLMLYAYADLPAGTQHKARQLCGDLVMHLLDGGYKIRRPDGQPTTYGDLTPLVATVGVPFNAQVTYLIVALGEQYPPADVEQKGSIEHQFYRLRAKHHAYYANPWKNPIRPQRVGSNPLVKGMNDRFHLMSAAYHSLALEMARAVREKRELDRTFMYRMGLSLVWTMRTIGGDRNALCNFMYAGMLSDPKRLDMIVEAEERGEATFQINRGVADGLEQLRRYPLDRFRRPGGSQPTEEPQWIDAQRPDDFHWKADPRLRFLASGPAGNNNVAAIDYLAAYWLMRLHALDRHPAAGPHAAVLR